MSAESIPTDEPSEGRGVAWLSRLGPFGLLVATGITGLVLAVGVAGGAIGPPSHTLPPPSVGQALTVIVFMLYGLGAVAVAVSGSRPFDHGLGRAGLGLLGFGLLGLAASSISLVAGAALVSPGVPLVTLLFGAGAALLGIVATAASLARRPGWSRVVGVVLLGGTLLVFSPLDPPSPLYLLPAAGLFGLGLLVLRASGVREIR